MARLESRSRRSSKRRSLGMFTLIGTVVIGSFSMGNAGLTGPVGIVVGTYDSPQALTPCVFDYELTAIKIAGRVPIGAKEYQVVVGTPAITLIGQWIYDPSAPFGVRCLGFEVQPFALAGRTVGQLHPLRGECGPPPDGRLSQRSSNFFGVHVDASCDVAINGSPAGRLDLFFLAQNPFLFNPAPFVATLGPVQIPPL